MRAMSLTAEEGEGEQNELRNLHLQLSNTTDLVKVLSQQLTELKEQVYHGKEGERGGGVGLGV